MTLDEIIKKQKEHLTNAQIKALAQAAERYKQVNATQRAEAYNSLHRGLTATRRGLQNVGLAGRAGKIVSGAEKAAGISAQEAYKDYNAQLNTDAYVAREAYRMARDAQQKEIEDSYAKSLQEWKAGYEKARAEAEKKYNESRDAYRKDELARIDAWWKERREAIERQRAAEEAARRAREAYQRQLAEQARQQAAYNEQLTDPRMQQTGNKRAASQQAKQSAKQEFYRQELDIDPRMSQMGNKNAAVQKAQAAAKNLFYQKGLDTDPRIQQMTAPEKAQYAQIAPAVNQYRQAEQIIKQNSARWDAEINKEYSPRDSVGKGNRSKAIQEKAAAESQMYRASAAMQYPQYSQYLLMSDAQFSVSYGAAKLSSERLMAEARKEHNLYVTTSNERDFRGKEQHRQNAKRLEEEAMRLLAPWDEANALRKGTGEAPSLAGTVTVSKSDGTKDKEYTDMTQYVGENQQNWNAVPWASKQEWNGQNWKTAREKGWEADDYAKKHGKSGSRYDALVNEWSYINGRTALLNTQKFQNVQELSNIGEFIAGIFGGGINRNAAYDWFRDECVMTYNNNPETSGTKVQKEQMDAMLTLANLMTDEERARFNGLLKTYGAKYADEYFEYLYNNVLPQRFLQYTQGELAFDTRNSSDRLMQSIMSVPTNIVQGVTKPLQTMFSEQNDPVAAQLSAAKGNTAQSMRGAIGSHYGEVGNFLYQTGMSMADSATVALISQGLGNVFSGALKGLGVAAETAAKIGSKAGSLLGGSILGGSAFNSSYDEALQRGLSPEQAWKTAFGNGVNEMLFESLSLDLLVSRFKVGDMLKVSKNGFVNWFVNTLVQGGVEGSEEVFTDIGNNIWDKMVNGIYSEELTKIREYVSQGMTLDEAKRKVSGEFAAQLGMSFAGGFASGGVMGGGSTFLGMLRGQDVAKIGRNLDDAAKAEIREYDFQNEEAKEILTGKLTDEDYGRLAMTRLEEMAQTDPIAAEKAAQALIDATARTDVKVDKRNQTLKTGTENSVSFDYDGVTDVKKMSGVQVEALRFAQTLVKSKVGGVNINVANQLFDKNGNEQNGWYDAKTNTVHVSLNGSQSVVYTISHELTHRLKSGNEEAYASMRDAMKSELESLDLTGSDLPGEYENILGDYLVKDGEQRSAWEALIEYEMDRYKKHNIDLDRESAEEEVVCRACETMLERSRLISSMISKNVRSAKTIAKFLASIYDDIASLKEEAESRGYEDGSPEKLFIDQYTDVEKIANAWANAMKTVSEKEEKRKPKTERIAKSKNGDYARLSKSETAKASGNIDVTADVVAEGENGKPLSIKSLDFDMRSGKMYKDLVEHGVMTEEEVVKFDRFLKDLVAYIKPNRAFLDMNESYTKDNRPFTAFKDNSDPLYKLSLDFSTLCRKRLTTQYIIEKLQLKLKKALSAEEQLAVRDMLKQYQKIDKGLQVACGMCYVEAARYKSPKQINMWLESDGRRKAMTQYFAVTDKQFTETVKQKQAEWKVQHGYADNATKDAMSASDRNAFNRMSYDLRQSYEMDAEHQAILDKALSLPKEQFLSAANLADLAEGDEAERTIYNAYTRFIRAATRSKSLEADIPYYYGDSESRVSDTFVKNVNAENGMRFDSWSDFQFTHLLDMITAITDLSVRGSAMHGYTKFPEFVRIFGKTGAMFNLSGVPQGIGLKQDGSLDFSPTESINEEEAIKLREEFPETAGFQSIGINDRHINALLDSDFIDYVIPYHVSGMNAKLRSIAKIAGWQDYTGTQNAKIDKSLDGNKANCDPSVWHVEPVFSEFFVGYNTGMSGIDAMRASAERYVDMCHERGMKPKFEQFLENDNYWKLLIDRKMINQKTGALIEQKAVKPNFDLDTIKREIDKYVNSYDQNREENAFNYIVDRWDEVPALVAKLEKEGKAEKKRQQEAAKNIDMLKGEMVNAMPGHMPLKAAAQKFSIKESDAQYMDLARRYESGDKSVESELRKQVDAAAKAAGYKYKGYHGTNASFTVFDPNKRGSKNFMAGSAYLGFFASKSRNTAEAYTGLNSFDYVSLALGGESAKNMEEIKTKRGFDERQKSVDDAKVKFEELYKSEHGYKEEVTDIVKQVVERAKELNYDANQIDMLEKVVSEQEEIEWNKKHLQDMYNAWYETNEYKEFKQYEESVAKEWEETEIKRRGYTPNVKELYIKMNNPFIYDFNGEERDTDSFAARMAKAQKEGYDGCIFLNVADGAEIDDIYTVFDNKQFKSADLITKDNDGNIIPLSERFKTDRTGEDSWKNEDIRYSLKEGEERAIKIADGKTKDGTTVSFIDRILDRQKTGETRTSKGSIKPNAWVGIYKDGKVYGRVKFGDPKWITKQSKEYKTSDIKDTNYDIDDSVGGKWYYPVLDVQDFRDNPITTNRAGQWGAAYDLPNKAATAQKNVRLSQNETAESFDKKTGFKLSDFDIPKSEVIDAWNRFTNECEKEQPRFAAAQKEFVARVKHAVSDLGFEIADPGEKSVKSSVGKLMRKNYLEGRKGYSISDFKDNVRATILMNSLDDISETMRRLRKEFPGIEAEAKADSSGYIGFHTTVKLNGVNCELQLSTPDMFAVKLQSDKIYEKWRNRDRTKLSESEKQEKREDDNRSLQLWNDFREKFGLTPEVLRMASSSLIGEARNLSPAEPFGVHAPSRNVSSSYSSSENGGLRSASTSLSSQVNRNSTLSIESTPPSEIISHNAEDSKGKYSLKVGTESLGRDYLKYLQLGAKVVTQTATEAEIKEFKQRMVQLSEDNRMAFLDRLREKLIRADEAAKVREVRDRQIARLKEEFKESREKARERRIRSDLTNTLKKGNDRIVQLLSRPTENAHVPVQLAQAVSEYAMRLNDLLTKSEPKTGEFAGMEKQTQKGALNAQKILDAYRRSFADEETIALAKAENPKYDPRGLLPTSEYDEQLVKMIEAMDSVIQVKRMSDLTTDELRLVMNTMRGVIHAVTDANKLIGTNENKTIWKAGDQMVEQLENAPSVSQKIRGYLETSLDLRRLAKIFSGSNENAEFVKLVDQLNKGAIEKERIAQTLQNIFKPVTDKYGDEIRKWYGKNAEWIDTGIDKNGHAIKITKGMRVSLAMHVLNSDNMRHIENGGLTIPNKEMYRKGNLADAYANGELVRMNRQQIFDIISHMTEAEKAYVEAAMELFHKRTGYFINKTSLALLGYRKAMIEKYFPIHTDKNFTKTDFASLKQDGTIEGQGFLKERVNASNPVYLEDITSVVNRQIRGVALYAGLAIPMRNFNAVMNASIYEDDNGVWSPRTTVKQTLTQKMGEYGAKVVKGFLEDTSEMTHVDVTPMERFAGKLATNYVKAVLLGNLKVAMKQVASYPTAAAVIPWKYLGKALIKGGRNGRVISRADVDLINQYTPLYQMRREGNANEIASIMAKRGMEQKLPWLLGWITKMDVMTVGRLWSAAEYMVADQQSLPVGSDEYYKAVAKVFNDTIQQTQPNFTPLQRNAALRSKNPVVRSLVLFGTQRMQNGGILIEAAMELKQSKGKSKAEIKAAKMKLGRAVASQIVQNILLIVASLGVDALRGRMKSWQDEDKDITPESMMKGMSDMFLSNFIGSFLGGSETYSLISGLFKKAMGETAYDTEFTVPALDAVETLINFAQSDVPDAVKYLLGDHTDEEKQKKAINFSYQLAKAFGYATGIPLENALKDLFKGIIPAIKDLQDWKKTGELNLWLHQSGKLDKKTTNANYKEWTSNGFKGSEYFYWENVLTAYGKRDEKIPILLEADLPNEKKAMLLRMMDKSGATSDGTVVYKSNGDVLIDFANPTEKQQALPMPTAETEETATPTTTPTATPKPTENPLTDARQDGVREAVAKGVPEQTAFDAFIAYQNMGKNKSDDYSRNDDFRAWLFANVTSPEQRAVLEYQVIGTAKKVEGSVTYRDSGVVYRDYTNESWFKLSEHNLAKDGTNKRYEAGKRLEKTGLSVDKTVAIYDGLTQYTKKAEWKSYLKKQGLSDEQINIFLWSRGWAKLK